MKNKSVVFAIFIIINFFSLSGPNDDRSINIVINNTNTNSNFNNNLRDRKKLNMQEAEKQIHYSNFFMFTRKKIVFAVLFLLIYYINNFKFSYFSSFFLFLRNKISYLWNKKKIREKYNDVY